MLTNYFKIAWRTLVRNKVNSMINISGLAIGIASVILILMYVQDELKYDRFYHHADHIFQVNLDGKMGGEEFINGNTPAPTGATLVNEFPEMETYTRIYRPGDVLVRYEGEESAKSFFTEKRVLAVDSNFLQVFSYTSMGVDPGTCLQKPNSVVLTEQTANKYFGSHPAVGKILLLGEQRKPCLVTGVLHNLPPQASLQFDMLVTMSTYPVVKRFDWSWVWLQVSTYVQLKDNAPIDAVSMAKLQAKFPAMVKREAAKGFERIGKPFDEFIKKGGRWNLQLQPITSVHLYSAGVSSRLTTLSDIKYVYIFSIIALFIIILACVNFMNLATARASKRAKEVGIRKVLGSEKSQLVGQFFAETMLYTLFATLISLVIVSIVLAPLNNISGKDMSIDLLFRGNLWLLVVVVIIVTGLLAGSYPAFYLTAFQPSVVLKGFQLFKSGRSNFYIRNGLVVFQFTVSITLIICTIIVFNQISYTRNKDLGIDKKNLLVVTASGRLPRNEEAFRQELSKLPSVVNASVATGIPTRENFGDNYIPVPAAEDENLIRDISLSSFLIDQHFIPSMGIRILQGRNFSPEYSDSASVILNETAVKQIGWKNPVGQYLEYPGNQQKFKVIAVVKDFNTQSLHSLVSPFALFHHSSKTYDVGSSYIIVKLNAENINKTLGDIEKKWKGFSTDSPFDFSFLDADFDALYNADKRMGTIFSIFTFLSLFVACLGLFGLALFTAELRTKEIGIRKVLGASVHGLVAFLSRDFVLLVLISSVFAFPIAWWGMNLWLADFAYRIDISPWVFLIAVASTTLIALMTVGFQAFRAASANPVTSLHSE